LRENPPRSHRINRACGRADSQLQASSGGETSEHINPRLATAMLICAHYRPRQRGPSSQLGLAQTALAADLANQLTSHSVNHLHNQYVSASANKKAQIR
jgi:hypothetical protein